MFDEQIHLLFSQAEIKEVLVKRRRFLLRITAGCFPHVIWRPKQSDTWEGLQFFFICL